ncbi:PAP2 superfamily protein [Gracilimonas mengyeensis]|uniref:PAP2 superfamily protein n=2 Tax=Gracilimonas mengyeensis TaxID=1302730 RepID=A0A521F6A9_9BACT|nr:PAP2 superfamily protein [Gracilimonas mengyeensis]
MGSSTYAQDYTSPKRFSKWFVNDPVSFARNLDSYDLLNFSAVAFNLSMLHGMDRPTSDLFQQRLKESPFLSITNVAGERALLLPLSLGMFGTSLTGNNYKFQDAAFTSFQSLIYTTVMVNTTKFIASRARPYEKEGVRDFDFFETNHTSFPSGHTASAFAYLTPWVVYYPGPLTYSLYIIPVGTALARISYGKHWFTDVGAGALIGTFWGYHLAKKHKMETGQRGFSFTPVISSKAAILNLSIKF